MTNVAVALSMYGLTGPIHFRVHCSSLIIAYCVHVVYSVFHVQL